MQLIQVWEKMQFVIFLMVGMDGEILCHFTKLMPHIGLVQVNFGFLKVKVESTGVVTPVFCCCCCPVSKCKTKHAIVFIP